MSHECVIVVKYVSGGGAWVKDQVWLGPHTDTNKSFPLKFLPRNKTAGLSCFPEPNSFKLIYSLHRNSTRFKGLAWSGSVLSTSQRLLSTAGPSQNSEMFNVQNLFCALPKCWAWRMSFFFLLFSDFTDAMAKSSSVQSDLTVFTEMCFTTTKRFIMIV